MLIKSSCLQISFSAKIDFWWVLEVHSARSTSRDRIVVSTSRCGRENPGSNPGHGRAEIVSDMAERANIFSYFFQFYMTLRQLFLFMAIKTIDIWITIFFLFICVKTRHIYSSICNHLNPYYTSITSVCRILDRISKFKMTQYSQIYSIGYL